MKSRSFRAARLAAAVLVTCCGAAASAQSTPWDPWTVLGAIPDDVRAGEPYTRPTEYTPVALHLDVLRTQLAGAPDEDAGQAPVVIAVPRPDGTLERFEVVRTYVLDRALSAQHPEILTYAGNGIENPSSIVRIDVNPVVGFRAMVYGPEGTYHVDPYTKNNDVYFASHWARNFPVTRGLGCEVPGDARPVPVAQRAGGDAGTDNSGQTLRTFRLAVATTGEWTAAYGGGTASGGLAAVTTIVNQVSGIYQNEFAIRFTLVSGTNVIYTNASTDPFTNGNNGTLLNQIPGVLNTNVGSANFDFGHCFGTGGGGVAFLGVVCTANKAGGVSSFISTLTDPYNRFLVSHEMGHQFNAGHSFNSNAPGCLENRMGGSAVEPGSGSTFMGYGGICGPDNIVGVGDDYPHGETFDEITSFAASRTCDTESATGNLPPVVSAGAARTIPANTPFALTPAVLSDPNGDPMTVKWEQRQLAQAATSLAQGDTGTNPISRSRRAGTTTTRFFPQNFLSANNGVTPSFPAGDILPTTNRTLVYRATALDNRAGGGGVGWGEVTLTVTTAAGPFRVTAPNTNVNWTGGSQRTITWNVANTSASPVNTANVEILLSTNGGTSFPIVLLSSTPNDGSADVTLPTSATTQARVMVRAVGNYFFDVSDANFTISAAPPALPTNVFAQPNPACTGQTVQLFASVGAGEEAQWFNGTCGLFPIGTGSPITVNAGTSANTYQVRARRISDGLASSCVNLTVDVAAAPTAPSGATVSVPSYCLGSAPATVTLTAAGGSGQTLRWFSGACGSNPVGTGNNLVVPAPAQTTTYFARWETACGTSGCASTTVTVNSAADFNGDGEFTFDDIQLFVSAYNGSEPRADFNNDGEWTFDDVQLFVTAFNTGC